jgi:hypothetical protein
MTTSALAPGVHERIAPLFRNWHPRYRGALVQLLALSALVAAIGQGENALLQAMADAFRVTAHPWGVLAAMGRLAPAVALPLVFLAAFVAWRADVGRGRGAPLRRSAPARRMIRDGRLVASGPYDSVEGAANVRAAARP